MSTHRTVEEYLADCDAVGRERLEAIRRVVHEVAPDAGERISYAIPAFTIDGKVFVFMAAWKEHVSMYPLPQGDPEIDAVLAPYAAAKGTAKFAHRDPLPLDAIRLIATAKLREAQARAEAATAKRAAKQAAAASTKATKATPAKAAATVAKATKATTATAATTKAKATTKATPATAAAKVAKRAV